MPVSGHRPCAKLLPEYLLELPHESSLGRRKFGPASPEGCDPLWDGAGYPFPVGDRDNLTVDTLSSKRRDCLEHFDDTAAAGNVIPVAEVRSLTVDKLPVLGSMRRAHSEPPKSMESRFASMQTMQVFGVSTRELPDGLRFQRRCLSPEPRQERREEVARRAAAVGNMDGIMTKRHFIGASPRGTLSPRLAARTVERHDIDSHPGRGRPGVTAAASGALPWASPSYEMQSEGISPVHTAPRQLSLSYCEKILEAEGYAKLIGRPPAVEDEKLISLALDKLRSCRRPSGAVKGRTYSSNSLDLNSICSWSMVSSEPNSPMAGASKRMFRSLSEISTNPSSASDEGCSSPGNFERQTLSKASRSIFNTLDDSELKSTVLSLTEENPMEDFEGEEFQSMEEPAILSPKVPLSLKRVVASMGFDTANLSADLLQAAVGASVKKAGMAQDRHYGSGCYLRRKAASGPSGLLRKVMQQKEET